MSFSPCASSVLLLSMGLWAVLCYHLTPSFCSRAPLLSIPWSEPEGKVSVLGFGMGMETP